jgi:hypothetical protein
MSYHDEQMRKRCEESGTHPATSDGKLRNDSCELVAHGDRFVYASEYEALEADNAKLYRVYDLQAGKIKSLKAQHAAALETLREVTDRLARAQEIVKVSAITREYDFELLENERVLAKARSQEDA